MDSQPQALKYLVQQKREPGHEPGSPQRTSKGTICKENFFLVPSFPRALGFACDDAVQNSSNAGSLAYRLYQGVIVTPEVTNAPAFDVIVTTVGTGTFVNVMEKLP